MGLTEADGIFSGIHEQGLNDLLRRFFTTRPRYLHFGSPGFVSATTVNATQIPSIPFPGVPGGIEWSVRFGLPVVDLHPRTRPLPPELIMGLGQVSVHTSVKLCIACESRERDQKEGKKYPGHRVKGPCFTIRVIAMGHLERTFGPDGEAVAVIVDAVELIDIEPNGLEAVIECLILQLLRAALAEVRLPLNALRAGAFSLVLTRGPSPEDDEIKVYGDVP